MPLPKIDACLICEGVRPELQNKNILLGFYGIAPHVLIWLRDFNIPAAFVFAFCAGRGDAGTYDIELRLIDPQGQQVSNPETSPSIKGGQLVPDRSTTNIFMGFQGRLGKPGTYRVSLMVDGKEHYSTTIDIMPAPAQTAFALA
jgi:hypothetical protein